MANVVNRFSKKTQVKYIRHAILIQSHTVPEVCNTYIFAIDFKVHFLASEDDDVPC